MSLLSWSTYLDAISADFAPRYEAQTNGLGTIEVWKPEFWVPSFHFGTWALKCEWFGNRQWPSAEVAKICVCLGTCSASIRSAEKSREKVAGRQLLWSGYTLEERIGSSNISTL